MIAKVRINNHIPDGVLVGLNGDGRLTVCIEFNPVHLFLFGAAEDQDSVAEWSVCEAHARRIAMVAAWNATGNGHMGSA